MQKLKTTRDKTEAGTKISENLLGKCVNIEQEEDESKKVFPKFSWKRKYVSGFIINKLDGKKNPK